ncbi:hypothetical protein [Streptomyces sp. NPDC059003]|uniref:hypothetical protein n=1 Tax=Streptomyces sp. NPDC059003 TaxID=3346691 RepID=UPI00369E2782
MAVLSASAAVISDAPPQSRDRGDIERVVVVVTHPSPRPPSAGHGVSLTVQSVLEAPEGAFPGLPGAAAAQEVEAAVASTLQDAPLLRHVRSRLVSSWGLPVPRE